MQRPIDPARFDGLVSGQGDQKLWGAPEIARVLGLSIDAVYRLARDPSVPIYRPGGRYFAVRSELQTWLRTK